MNYSTSGAVTSVTSDAWGSSSNACRLTALGRVADRVTYKPGWKFIVRERMDMDGAQAVLLIEVRTYDSDDITREDFLVVHHFGVSRRALEDEKAAKHELLSRVHDVERHEMREFFRVDGERFDPPGHGPNENPY